jgi:hypothetical protein
VTRVQLRNPKTGNYVQIDRAHGKILGETEAPIEGIPFAQRKPPVQPLPAEWCDHLHRELTQDGCKICWVCAQGDASMPHWDDCRRRYIKAAKP